MSSMDSGVCRCLTLVANYQPPAVLACAREKEFREGGSRASHVSVGRVSRHGCRLLIHGVLGAVVL